MGSLFLLLALALGTQMPTGPVSRQSGLGRITGTVLDEGGRPLADATVTAIPVGRALHAALRRAQTNARGRFVIANLDLGVYHVYAMKEEAGYPDTSFSLYGGESPTAVLTPAARLAEVHIHMGPKAGFLSGHVSDAITGAPVSANFMITRVGSPRSLFGTSQPPDYRVLLPARTTVSVEVVAAGYRPARLSGLTLPSGQKRKLDIWLEPSGSRFYIDVRRAAPGTVQAAPGGPGGTGGACQGCGSRKASLRVEMVTGATSARQGGTIPMWLTVTNADSEPLATPVSPNLANLGPAASRSRGSTRELIVNILLDTGRKSTSLGSPIVLYGTPSAPGSTRLLRPGESLVIEANLWVRFASSRLRPPTGNHAISARAVIVKVAGNSSSKAHAGHEARVAFGSSRAFMFTVLPSH